MTDWQSVSNLQNIQVLPLENSMLENPTPVKMLTSAAVSISYEFGFVPLLYT